MAELEAEAKPVLAPMILDRSTLLDQQHQRVVAAWATKTMLTMQALNLGGWRVAGDDVYRWFCEHREPLPCGHVWLARYAGESDPESQWPISAHAYGFHLTREGDPPWGDDAPTTAYTVAFAIGTFAVWLWGHTIPDGPVAVGGANDRLLHIWPAEDVVRWPPSVSLADDRALEAVTRCMPIGTATVNNLQIGAA